MLSTFSERQTLFEKEHPPKTIISDPVQTAVWLMRAAGALTLLVDRQESVMGL